jgi:hypothetical protein
LIDRRTDRAQLAARVYRPDLYREAMVPLDVSVPIADTKPEGAHASTWALEALPHPIPMAPDTFCDGQVFEGDGA